jgi:CBS domain-containing protein
VLTRSRTQTVNVYSATGEKEYVVRLRPPSTSESALRSMAFSTVEDLVDYLLDAHSGELERDRGVDVARPGQTREPREPQEAFLAYEEFEARVEQVAADLREGRATPTPTVRSFLAWIGAKRRGYTIVAQMRRALDKYGLTTSPDFESAYIDSPISLVLKSAEHDVEPPAVEVPDDGGGTTDVKVYSDPTYRISKLQAANTVPMSVEPGDPLAVAVTIMIESEYSQLPVMTSEREVKGVVSWKSIGARLAVGKPIGPVRDFMEHHEEVLSTASLFRVINRIVEHDYVLVRGPDNRIVGIVTASDLSLQFRQLTEPFLLLGEIENHIRRLLSDRITSQELQDLCDPGDSGRTVEGIADLTFGEYVRLLEKPERWDRLGVAIDRALFVQRLEDVRKIRNDVMHFDPDGLLPEDLDVLRSLTRLLQNLQAMGAT